MKTIYDNLQLTNLKNSLFKQNFQDFGNSTIMKGDSMKKQLCRIIFHNELEEESQRMSKVIQIERRQMYLEMEHEKMLSSIMKRAFKFYSDAKIVGIEKNKNDEELIIVWTHGAIYLMGKSYWMHGSSLPKLYYNIEYGYENYKKVIKGIYINDVLMINNNIGNGSIALNALINYAKEIGAPKITGSLSPVDDDHADRRNHFYEKFGFNIINSKIELNLTE